MFEGEASQTAERVAVERAAHQQLDSPLILVDPLAIQLIDRSQASELLEHPEHHDRSPIARPTRAIVVVRSRIAEDELAHAATQGVTQYIVLGAGFDTFAYRNPHAAVRVYEVDHPATQQVKRERLSAAAIHIPSNVVYVSCDFSRDSLPEALRQAGFDPSRPAVVAWLGVSMYLDRTEVMQTLCFIASLPEGTAVIFDYALSPETLPWLGRVLYRRVLNRLAERGEPWKSFFDPGQLAAALVEAGFTRVEDLGADEINERFLAGRTDGLKAASVGHIAIARK